MRIIFLLDEDISRISGVVKKINMQIQFWSSAGHEVKVVSMRSNANGSSLTGAEILSLRKEEGLLQSFRSRRIIVQRLNRVLSDYNPDLIYCRYIMFAPGLTRMLKRQAKYIVEINTDERREFYKSNRIIGIYNMITRGVFLGSSSGFVTVTRELAGRPSISRFEKPTITLTNGLLTPSSRIKSHRPDKGPVTLGFVGSPNQRWHGISKILYMASMLTSNHFHIIGPEVEDIRRISHEKYDLKNVEVHGYLDPDKTFNILSGCDAGISTLSIHENRMKEACPLKTREYLSMGLPVIIGYIDPDLEKGFEDAVLFLGTGKDNVRTNMDKISNFLTHVRDIDPKNLAERALKVFDAEARERARLEFFENIIRSG